MEARTSCLPQILTNVRNSKSETTTTTTMLKVEQAPGRSNMNLNSIDQSRILPESSIEMSHPLLSAAGGRLERDTTTTSSLRTPSTTSTRTRARRRTRTGRLGGFVRISETGQLIYLTLIGFLLIVGDTHRMAARAAVVRPTNFLGLSPEEAQAISSGQQQQQQQPTAITQVTSSNPQSPIIPDGQQQQQQTPSTKINPLKSRFCTSLNGAKLDAPMGLQSMAIDDLALTASSYSNEQVGPQMARLNLDISGGAWCPVKPISNSNFGKEWIQAKLNRSFVVTAIETQGRFGMGNGKEFVPSYQIEYSRNGGHTWHKWKDFRGSVLLRANEDVNSPVRNELSPPIVGANVIRILPFSQHLRTACLRFELHGCPYDEGAPMAYATGDGVVEPRWGHLIDYTYDGHRQRGHLSQGLGQLVDGVKGPDNFSHNAGFEWVGWKSMNGDVVIEFSFKTVRNFTGALFHSNNLFSSGVEVFQSVDVHYGIDVPLSMESLKDSLFEQRRRDALYRREPQLANNGDESHHQSAYQQQQTLWSNDILSIEYEPDKKMESSRPVTVHLKQRLANKLRFVLKFASKWILVSEVEFLSHPVELLSLASVDQRATPALMGALSPAKTYDEFVAILREHQLRRIATNAFLESFGGLMNSTAQSSATTESSSSPGPSSDQPAQGGADQPATGGSSQQQSVADRSPYDEFIMSTTSTHDPLAGRRVTGPAIPAWSTSGGQPSTTTYQDSPAAPSTNPLLNPQVMAPFPGGPMVQQQQLPDQFQPDLVAGTLTTAISAGADPFLAGNQSSASSINDKRTLGLATVISFVLVSILAFVGVLFAISSYRLRHRPKLGIPHLGAHHLISSSTNGTSQTSKTMSPPSLQSFMSVFSSSAGAAAAANQSQHPHLYQENNHFNAIFATGERYPLPGATAATHQRERQSGGTAAQTLRRLANTIGQQPSKEGHPLLFGGGAGSQPNQLLVSMKDSSSGKGPVSTQLILGLNQANPLAQQQVYSGCQGGQPTYSTSMSMASSSTTTGHQGDYGEYAIPDATQPIIPPIAGGHNNGHHHQHQLAFTNTSHLHQNHLHHHLNPAFSASQATGSFKQPAFGCQTELRSSHRQHQATLVQPQIIHQQQQDQQMTLDHKYELIQQQQEPQRQHQTAHNRALSGQMGCGQQSTVGTFNSMTLGGHGRNGQLMQDSPKRIPLNECSPGAGSSASGATTATTSANSSSAGGVGGDLARYYYAND